MSSKGKDNKKILSQIQKKTKNKKAKYLRLSTTLLLVMLLFFLFIYLFIYLFIFYFWWILSYIEMKQPWVYMCSPSRSPLPPPSPPIGFPSASGPSACLMHPTWAGDVAFLIVKVSYMCYWLKQVSN